ncbi:helix-turn-helix domain-containing protein [Desulfomonile tiedjei]|uniref:Putative transcriptional regulator n=1 Tax=Desulfomonile tiedjei (strain ATCC 49306 / DSM 6799 / DCB-1) TaxID=706587 RepID=I4C5Y8_DESTA|nr:helix-turn-helix transcriptional regulator [Desulfomonile tiedjei]AFM24979.1 putative transcriptional regulator [Desulfomonile tiedjei DSM 6799]
MIADQTTGAQSLTPTNTPSHTPSLHDQFYGTDVSENDRLSFSLLLEKVCDGLGHWYLGIDSEFQKDILAGSKLFWERQSKQADVKGETDSRTTDTNDQTAATVKIQCATEQVWTDPTPNHFEKMDAGPEKPRSRRRSKTTQNLTPTRLKRLREQMGISQYQLANMAGCMQPSIYRFEYGQVKNIRKIEPSVREKIEQIFNTPFAELMQPCSE